MDHFSAHGPWYPPEATRFSQLNPSPQLKGNSCIPPCSPYSRLQEWCIYGIIYHYAPFLLSNSMVMLSGPKSRSQNPKPISKEDFSTHQSGNPWQQSEDHSRIPITWRCRSWVGNSFMIIPRAIIRGYKLFQSAVKESSISIILGQLNWSIQAAINQPVCIWPNWANSYSTVGIQSHSSNFKMARSVLTQFRQYSL
ncbi:hypothetical protein O181_118398 [Austropuccinia psidii MF-1]|uniref:Uncharacterized protein n=1 Tax=Austropuccinia psidii MF-1 TaxID=1389203 RepID=A0A9Q3KC03_9BASI|nr:hypothetical protein [Austropuccinia psidii MF-1]